MKEHRLWILALSLMALTTGIVMASLDLYNSWSQHESTPEEPMLNFTLLCIIGTFLIRSFTHPEKGRAAFWGLRHKHLCRIVAGLFAGVLVFSVNHPEHWISTAHLIFTGSGIGMAYITQLAFFEKSSQAFWGTLAGAIGGIGLFILGWWFGFYSVGTAEVLAAFPIVIFVIGTNK